MSQHVSTKPGIDNCFSFKFRKAFRLRYRYSYRITREENLLDPNVYNKAIHQGHTTPCLSYARLLLFSFQSLLLMPE